MCNDGEYKYYVETINTTSFNSVKVQANDKAYIKKMKETFTRWGMEVLTNLKEEE